MRHLFPLLLLLVLSLAILPAAYDSNALGMDLGWKEKLEGAGYEGEREGNVSLLYLDGVLVQARSDNEDGYIIREPGREERIVWDSQGRRLSRTVTSHGEVERTVYEYDGERLAAVTVSTSSGIAERIEYLDKPSGLLSGLSGTKRALYSPSFFLYEAEDGYVKVSFHGEGEASHAPEPYQLREDGGWESGEKVLDTSGLIVAQGGTASVYDDDGRLTERRTREGDALRVEHYDMEGRIQLEEYYSGDILERVFDYSDPGSVVETRYNGSQPAYRLTYDGDGKRVKKVENLK